MKLNEVVVFEWIDPSVDKRYAGFSSRQAFALGAKGLQKVEVGGELLFAPKSEPPSSLGRISSLYNTLMSITKMRDRVISSSPNSENALTRLTKEQQKLGKQMRYEYEVMDKSGITMSDDVVLDDIISAAEAGLLTAKK